MNPITGLLSSAISNSLFLIARCVEASRPESGFQSNPFRKKTVHGKGIGFCGSPDCRKVDQLSSEPVPYASITIEEEESIILLFLSGLLMVRETPSTSRVGLRLSVCPASHFVLKHI